MSSQATKLKEAIDAYSEGYSDPEVMKLLGMSDKQFKRRYEEDESFRDFVDMGRTLSYAWWMSQGRINIHNVKFNTNLWTFVVKNRFEWAEKLEAKTKSNEVGRLDLKDLKQEITKLARGIASASKNKDWSKLSDADVLTLMETQVN